VRVPLGGPAVTEVGHRHDRVVVEGRTHREAGGVQRLGADRDRHQPEVVGVRIVIGQPGPPVQVQEVRPHPPRGPAPRRAPGRTGRSSRRPPARRRSRSAPPPGPCTMRRPQLTLTLQVDGLAIDLPRHHHHAVELTQLCVVEVQGMVGIGVVGAIRVQQVDRLVRWQLLSFGRRHAPPGGLTTPAGREPHHLAGVAGAVAAVGGARAPPLRPYWVRPRHAGRRGSRASGRIEVAGRRSGGDNRPASAERSMVPRSTGVARD
jgi:hypothetical protein